MSPEIFTPALIASVLTAIIAFLISLYRDSVLFKREMKKQTHIRILEKAEKAVGYHFTYYTKLIEMQKVFEVIKASLAEYPNNADGLNAVFPKLQEISTIISKLQNDYQIEANSIFLYIESTILNDWYDNKIEELVNCLVLFETNQNSFDESLSRYQSYVQMDWTQQDDEWKNVIANVTLMQGNLDKTLKIIKEYIQISKSIVQEVRLKVPKKHLKI